MTDGIEGADPRQRQHLGGIGGERLLQRCNTAFVPQADGTGDISIVTDAGSVINSGGAGIVAINLDTAIAASADSNIIVTAYGTINSGTTPNINGAAAQGIVAGYYGNTGGSGTTGTANTAVNGTVVVNNYANITAAAGYGIDAYNYGNGDVTVNDKAGTTVSGAQYGIGAFSLSGGPGDVTVNVAANATVNGGSYGIYAVTDGNGNISRGVGGSESLQHCSMAFGLSPTAAGTFQLSRDAGSTINSGGGGHRRRQS